MTRKKILIIVGGIAGVGIMTSIIFFARDRFFPQKKVQQMEVISITMTPAPKEELLLWDDPAGFTFQYPKGLTVNKHDEDQENYAHVELTSTQHQGNIIVWAKDTTAVAISQWLKNEKTLKDQSFVDTTLGGNDAVKVLVKEPKKKQITATLDEDVVVIVETELDDEGFWQKVNDTVVGSFTFSVNQLGTIGDQSTVSSDEAPPSEADEEESVE
jgi:hypothetical protein